MVFHPVNLSFATLPDFGFLQVHLRTLSMKLPREFYTRSDVLELARDLLGKKLVVRNEAARASPESSSKPKRIAARKIALRTRTAAGAPTARKRCTALAVRHMSISFTACTTSSMS